MNTEYEADLPEVHVHQFMVFCLPYNQLHVLSPYDVLSPAVFTYTFIANKSKTN